MLALGATPVTPVQKIVDRLREETSPFDGAPLGSVGRRRSPALVVEHRPEHVLEVSPETRVA